MNRLALLIVFLAPAVFASGIRLTNVPIGTLNGYDQFTVSVIADLDLGSLTGAYLEMTVNPSTALHVVSVAQGTASASPFFGAPGTNRIVWANAGGLSGTGHELARVTYAVASPAKASSVTIEPNILEMFGSTGWIIATSTSAPVSVNVPTPVPLVTVTAPTPDPNDPNNPGSGDASTDRTGAALGGCAAAQNLASTSFFWFLFAGVGLLLLRRKASGLGGPAWIWGLLLTVWTGLAGARTIQISDATSLANLCQNHFVPGDVIVIQPGTYNLSSTVAITPSTCGSGVLGVPIVLSGGGPGEVILDGGGKAVLGLGEGLSYWIIEKMTLQNGGPWTRAGSLPVTPPHLIAGEGVSYGIVIRNNRFTGSIAGTGPGWPVNKSAVYLNGIASAASYNEGFVIEGNTFNNIDFTNATADGYSYVNVLSGSYSVIRGNTITHTNRTTAPYHLIEVDSGGGSLIERNFLYGVLRGNSNSDAVVIRRQSTRSVVRNNIIYVDAGEVSGSPTGWIPVAAIFLGEGSGTKNLIHNNSIKMVKTGVNAKLLVAHIYSYTWGEGAYVTDNIFEGGDFGVSSAWDSSSCTAPLPAAARIDLQYNFTFGNAPYDTRQGVPEYRCSYSWTNGLTDTGTAYNGSAWDQAVSYVLHATPNPAKTGGGTALNRCSTLKPGTAVACTAETGAYGGPDPYGSTSMFTFCGDPTANNRPDYDQDRRFELNDVLQLSPVNATLAGQVAKYLTSFTRSDLPCLSQIP
ncbi:MAG: hypothetical protein V1495_10560 [Pseudomonadota bacterium]